MYNRPSLTESRAVEIFMSGLWVVSPEIIG